MKSRKRFFFSDFGWHGEGQVRLVPHGRRWRCSWWLQGNVCSFYCFYCLCLLLHFRCVFSVLFCFTGHFQPTYLHLHFVNFVCESYFAQGYSWATVVELLSTAFQSGPFGSAISGVDPKTGKPAPMALGNYFLAIDIEALVDVEVFKKNAGNLLRFIRGSQKDPRGAYSYACVRVNYNL